MSQLLQFVSIEANKRANYKVGTVLLDTLYSTLRIDVVMDKQPQNLKVCFADKYKRRVWALSNIACRFDKEGVNCAGTESEQTVGVFACSIANTSLDYQGD